MPITWELFDQNWFPIERKMTQVGKNKIKCKYRYIKIIFMFLTSKEIFLIMMNYFPKGGKKGSIHSFLYSLNTFHLTVFKFLDWKIINCLTNLYIKIDSFWQHVNPLRAILGLEVRKLHSLYNLNFDFFFCVLHKSFLHTATW